MLSDALAAVLNSGALQDKRSRTSRDEETAKAFAARRKALSRPAADAYEEKPALGRGEAGLLGAVALLSALAGANPAGINQGVQGFVGAREAGEARRARNHRSQMDREEAERKREAGLYGVDADEAATRAATIESDRLAALRMREAARNDRNSRMDRESAAKAKALAELNDALSNPRSILGVDLAVQQAKQLGIEFSPESVETARAQATLNQRKAEQDAQNSRRVGFNAMVEDLRRAVNDQVKNFEAYTPEVEAAMRQRANAIAAMYPEFGVGLPDTVPPSAQTFKSREFDRAKKEFDDRLAFMDTSRRDKLAMHAAEIGVRQEMARIAEANGQAYRANLYRKEADGLASKMYETVEKDLLDIRGKLKAGEARKDSLQRQWTGAQREANADPENESKIKRAESFRKSLDDAIVELDGLRGTMSELETVKKGLDADRRNGIAQGVGPGSPDFSALRSQAQAAIANGADPSAVAQRYYEQTGQRL